MIFKQQNQLWLDIIKWNRHYSNGFWTSYICQFSNYTKPSKKYII